MSRQRMTIEDIRKQLLSDQPDSEWLKQLEQDPRRGVQRLLERFRKQQEQKRKLKAQWEAMFHYERFYDERQLTPVAGVDEAGRGPLAGPVVAAAVVLPPDCYIAGLNDSKTLSAQKREILYEEIVRVACDWAVEAVSADVIDAVNIYTATVQAMTGAVNQLRMKPRALLIDALSLPEVPVVQERIVGGDRRSASIAAASVLAKVTRDRIMVALAEKYPQYGFERHKGYGTAEHIQALSVYGASAVHRRSFAPVRERLTR